MKQACAAVGQAILMMAWRDAFRRHGKSVGQVLLTYGAFSDRARYLDLKKAIDAMFHWGRPRRQRERRHIHRRDRGDLRRQRQAVRVGGEQDGRRPADPPDRRGRPVRPQSRGDKDAHLIPTVDEVTKDIERIAGDNKNERSTGGMRTKINGGQHLHAVRLQHGHCQRTLTTSSSGWRPARSWGRCSPPVPTTPTGSGGSCSAAPAARSPWTRGRRERCGTEGPCSLRHRLRRRQVQEGRRGPHQRLRKGPGQLL